MFVYFYTLFLVFSTAHRTKPINHPSLKPSLVVFQLRSSRNFCIDIILMCIILGIAAYLYKWVLSGLPPFSSTCISWRILYEGSLTYCWTVFFVQCPKEVKACCEGYRIVYYVGFWFSGWCLKSCSSLNRSHPYFLLTLGLRFPFFCFFPRTIQLQHVYWVLTFYILHLILCKCSNCLAFWVLLCIIIINFIAFI